MYHTTIVSDPSGDGPNEDWAAALPHALIVLDGVTVRAGMPSGCRHGTPWYTRRLGTALLDGMTREPCLPNAVAAAITETAAAHDGFCDLSTLGAPSAALAILAERDGYLEWLILADITLVLDTVDGIRVVSDRRVSEVTAGLNTRTPELARKMRAARETYRNQPGGYFVAAADPSVANEAVTGSIPRKDVQRVLIATDGAARSVDLFGAMTWAHALEAGPGVLIETTRRYEDKDPDCTIWPDRTKNRDDATAVLLELPPAPLASLFTVPVPATTASHA